MLKQPSTAQVTWATSAQYTGVVCRPFTTYCYRITTTGASPIDRLGSNPSPQFTTLQRAPKPNPQPLTFDVLGRLGRYGHRRLVKRILGIEKAVATDAS